MSVCVHWLGGSGLGYLELLHSSGMLLLSTVMTLLNLPGKNSRSKTEELTFCVHRYVKSHKLLGCLNKHKRYFFNFCSWQYKFHHYKWMKKHIIVCMVIKLTELWRTDRKLRWESPYFVWAKIMRLRNVKRGKIVISIKFQRSIIHNSHWFIWFSNYKYLLSEFFFLFTLNTVC